MERERFSLLVLGSRCLAKYLKDYRLLTCIIISLCMSGCFYKTQYGYLTAGQLAEKEHTQDKTLVEDQPGNCRILNIRALQGEGVLEIGINPTVPNLHVRAAKDNDLTQLCEVIDLTCKECEFVPLAVLIVKDYKIENVKYFTDNLIYRFLVLPEQIEYSKSALRTIKAQQH